MGRGVQALRNKGCGGAHRQKGTNQTRQGPGHRLFDAKAHQRAGGQQSDLSGDGVHRVGGVEAL